ncbi:NifU family protein [Halarchaeum sp. P4]|uniref:NifU family protein n=1 Tax=Halarchaeum sp. P4 TaxID=3421639 RepID=UPI003EB83670
MSTGHETDGDAGVDTDAELRERVETFLARNFPQISMHGGTAGVEAVDAERGELWLALGGACSGCGISPMTVQAIQTRLPQEIPELDTVHVDAGGVGMHF